MVEDASKSLFSAGLIELIIRATFCGNNILNPSVIKVSLPADVLWGSFVTHSFLEMNA